MHIKRLDGALLNYWVARSAGLQLATTAPRPGLGHDPESGLWHPQTYCPASDWSQGGPIVANEWYGIEDQLVAWFGPDWPQIGAIRDAPLKWFMRAYVAMQFGDEVEDQLEAFPMPLRHLAPAEPARTESRAGSRLARWLTHVGR